MQIDLQAQPFTVLTVLLENAGQVVTRGGNFGELRRTSENFGDGEIWYEVDFRVAALTVGIFRNHIHLGLCPRRKF